MRPIQPEHTFQRMQKTLLGVTVSLLISTVLLYACGGLLASPEERAATQTADALDRIAVQTLDVLRTAVDPESLTTPVPAITNTILPATRTPLPTETPWPDPVHIQVSVDTNCRSGPGPPFPMVGALMVGETTLVLARSTEANYWIVENPDNPGRDCWLWGKHASVDGDTEHLPQVSPPATATPEPGTIAGWVYIDANNNGMRGDPGDGPISGATLTLRVGACPGGSSAATVQTDDRGRYQISGLIPTRYCLSGDASDLLIPNTWTIYLSSGQLRDEINFRRIP